MKLSAPTVPVFWIAVILVLLAVLAVLGVIPALPVPAFWLAVTGFVVLALGNLLTGI